MHLILQLISLVKALGTNLLNTFLHNPNQFASGGLLLMLVGAIGAYARKVPEEIYDWIAGQITVSMSITDDNKAFHWMKAWLEEQRIMRRTRRLDVYNKGSEKYIMVPAPGSHWMLYKKRILRVHIIRNEVKQANEIGAYGKAQRAESIKFVTLGRSQKIFREMMQEVYSKFMKHEEKKPELYVWGGWGEWREVSAFSPRPMSTVILSEKDKERIVKEITDFRANRKWYTEMGIPYRKGMLFYGPPGTGKTSTVSGLSNHFNANVYILKLADMDDMKLVQAAAEVEPNSFLILEDIDTVKQTNRRGEEEQKDVPTPKGVSLSGLLNVVDGLLSPTGAVFIMTTNHPEKLDPALIRPGRVDLSLEIGYASEEQKKEMYRRFFSGDIPQKYLNQEMTMADLQQKLIEERNHYDITPAYCEEVEA